MQLRIQRKPSGKKSTFGELIINSVFQCYTLEDPVRSEKIAGETAIPAGEYKIDLTYSPKFKMLLPLLLHVPNFTDIRIHAGNSEVDTAGCVLVGERLVLGQLWYSRRALNNVLEKIVGAYKFEPVTILIANG